MKFLDAYLEKKKDAIEEAQTWPWWNPIAWDCYSSEKRKAFKEFHKFTLYKLVESTKD